MELKIDKDALAVIAADAIFKQLDEDTRESVLKQAIEGLLTPSTNAFPQGKTPLQKAFDAALSQAAFRVVQEEIANNPELNAKIHELIGPLISSALKVEADNYDYNLSNKIGEAVGNYLAECARERTN